MMQRRKGEGPPPRVSYFYRIFHSGTGYELSVDFLICHLLAGKKIAFLYSKAAWWE